MKTNKKGTRKNVWQIVSERIIGELEKGTVPWQKPWTSEGIIGAYNLFTGKDYRGINRILLAPGAYATFRQVQKMGGSVKKGSAGNLVVFWGPSKKEREIKDPDTQEVIDVKKETYFVLRYYYVFHESDIVLKDGTKTKLRIPGKKKTTAQKIKIAEGIIKGYQNGPSIIKCSDIAAYSPSSDAIYMPKISQFKNSKFFYATMFHELVHSTGHESRLNRGLNGGFGSHEYSKEELVAEIGANILCNNAGIDTQEVFQHNAAYIKSWLGKLKNNPRWIVSAAQQAEKAADRILGHQPDYNENGKRDEESNKKNGR